ncbi:transmembrane protein 106A [Engraulis encrasicolus]|uniref:transmembrane protein 106A n=1 Tax=Engraulis encrasicolus TaxID=184585 RepID=UPI002FD6216A
MGGLLSRGAEEDAQTILPRERVKPEGRGASHNTADCPTCQGTGRIPRGQENQLVAVIPCSDQRLKPRHTKLYVALSVGVCLVFSVLVLFFLFPRSVSLSDMGIQSSSVVFSDKAVNITVYNTLNITNDNYVMVEGSAFSAQVFYGDTVVGKLSSPADITTFRPRSKKQYPFQVKISVTDAGLVDYCRATSTVHILFFRLQLSMTVYYMAHYEQLSLETFEYLDCGANSTVPHMYNNNAGQGAAPNH